MTNLKTLTAIGATAALVAVGSFALAQDDLDDLLKDLESDTTVEQAESPKAEEEEPEGAPAAAEESDAKATPVEAPAVEEADEDKPAEEPAAEAVEEAPKAEAEAPTEEAPAAKDEPAEEPVAEAPAPKAEPQESDEEESALAELANDTDVTTPVAAKANIPAADEELIDNIRTMEEVRRKAFNSQARREIAEARRSMEAKEYKEAEKHYSQALRLMNDSPLSEKFRRECEQGVAESLYRAALLEEQTGRRERAVELMEKAIDMRHPQARKQLESWLREGDPSANKTDYSEIAHRRTEEDYKKLREKNRLHMHRAKQLLSTREIDRALDECELVLVNDPYNQDAIRLRNAIQKKRMTILKQEFDATRDGYIADVTKAWRPVYAPNARQLDDVSSSTVKKSLGDDPERSQEQSIIQRMREMRLPTISFKPPATIIDAVEYFRGASKDFDKPDIPLEQRGFNFVLKTPETLRAQATEESSDDNGFGADDESSQSNQSGVPVIPMITASNITFYDALKLVCESVDYKFKVQGPIVMVMQKNMSTDEMVTRSYPVVAAFLERIGSATSDMKELKSAGGFGSSSSSSRDDGGDENQEQDWKEFFTLMGVQWPEGSSILYIKTLGKLRVKNTYENLAELEKALTELNVDQKLIEIETRFVEVCQEDLNSLGFEWILNSDYSLNTGRLGKWMGINDGAWGTSSGSTSYSRETAPTTGSTGGSSTKTLESVVSKNNTTYYSGSQGANWIRGRGDVRSNVGINALGGNSGYSNGNRYLSTVGNHISGSENSTNDQFMRVNAFLGSADLSMILHMLSQRSDTDLLSAPKVLTRPGEEAVIKVVTEYIYPTDYDVQLQSSSSSSSGSSGGGQSAILAVVEPQSFVTREVGVILDVTPTLTDDGNLIDLKLNTQVVDEPTWKNYGMRIPFTGNSSLQSFTGIGEIFTGLSTALNTIGATLTESMKAAFTEQVMDSATAAMGNLTGNDSITYYDAPMEQPFFHVRSVDSSVSIYPGATIVMGGLITEARKAMDDKVPFLGDLPFIGRLFRSHAEQTTKRNLLIFVTTRLVDVRGREVSMASSDPEASEVKEAPAPEAK